MQGERKTMAKRRRDERSDRLGESKVCPRCGLPFSNRKKWASRGLWDSVVYCSERCRRAAGRSPTP